MTEFVRFYGYNVDDEHYTGRLGSIIRKLNRTRLFVERLVEVTAVVHDAIQNEEQPLPVANRLLEEGLTRPATSKARAPLHVLDAFKKHVPDNGEIEGRFYKNRDYTQRQGRRLDVEREERTQGIYPDRSFSIMAAGKHNRSNRYHSEPLVRECFKEV